jgi:hypothetical protein
MGRKPVGMGDRVQGEHVTPPLFLTAAELRDLTGYALKDRQIAQLRTMGIAFRLNGHGKPVVTRAAVEGTATQQGAQSAGWQPAVLQGGRNGR